MNERPLKIRGRRLARFVGENNRRSGDCMSWRLVTLKLIRAANTEPLRTACKVSNASLKIARYLFAALFRSFYPPQTIVRCPRYAHRWITQFSFNSFMAGQQLPFR
jgi:hypothetical protein